MPASEHPAGIRVAATARLIAGLRRLLVPRDQMQPVFACAGSYPMKNLRAAHARRRQRDAHQALLVALATASGSGPEPFNATHTSDGGHRVIGGHGR